MNTNDKSLQKVFHKEVNDGFPTPKEWVQLLDGFRDTSTVHPYWTPQDTFEASVLPYLNVRTYKSKLFPVFEMRHPQLRYITAGYLQYAHLERDWTRQTGPHIRWVVWFFCPFKREVIEMTNELPIPDKELFSPIVKLHYDNGKKVIMDFIRRYLDTEGYTIETEPRPPQKEKDKGKEVIEKIKRWARPRDGSDRSSYKETSRESTQGPSMGILSGDDSIDGGQKG